MSEQQQGGVDRREFLGGAVLGGAGAAIGLSAYFTNGKSKGPDLDVLHANENKLVKMGFIGVGNRGGSLLRTALQVPGAVPIAVSDVQPAKRGGAKTDINSVLDRKLPSSVRSKYDVTLYEDYRRLLDNPDVEAVVIATPHYLHGPMAIDAIEAGKHVYCEKALAFTVGENQDIFNMVKGGAKAGEPGGGGDQELVFQVGHQRHYSPLYKKVKELCDGDRIGDIAWMRAQWNLNDEIRRPTADPALEKVVNWRLYSELSGGLTTEFATHQIDIANWLLDTHPDSVAGFGGIDWYDGDGRDTQDNIHLVFNYKVAIPDRDAYGRIKTNAAGEKLYVLNADGTQKKRNVKFTYTSTMANAQLGPSELICGRYGTIGTSLAGGEFWKEKKAREDPSRIAEGTNPKRALQKSILKSGPTVATSFAGPAGDPIEERIMTPEGIADKRHWSHYISPIKGAYDKVETLLAMDSFVDNVRLARDKKPFSVSADVEIGVWSAIPALMANLAMREERTVYWSEFEKNGA